MGRWPARAVSMVEAGENVGVTVLNALELVVVVAAAAVHAAEATTAAACCGS